MAAEHHSEDVSIARIFKTAWTHVYAPRAQWPSKGQEMRSKCRYFSGKPALARAEVVLWDGMPAVSSDETPPSVIDLRREFELYSVGDGSNSYARNR